jgi:hypothetical protein
MNIAQMIIECVYHLNKEPEKWFDNRPLMKKGVCYNVHERHVSLPIPPSAGYTISNVEVIL